ncbi:GLIPR1-like protein 1 [Physella acuta]|uniref:GLIPR1-like protein 1 n=1 Tax=Physella acuta TaxID=109671 RepID=UPI0027DC2026|nr:GLIPR1-like protein 1 [Physella acuta]
MAFFVRLIALMALIFIITKAAEIRTSANVTTAPPVLTAEHIKVILDSHNEARRLENAKVMPDLVWNAELAMKAQNWTDACKFAHQPPRTRRWGENIAAVGNTRPIPNQLIDMINEWIAEKKFNVGGTFEECCSFKSSDCCHYTQAVWANTRQVGCGYTACENLAYGSGTLTNIAFLACYYTPSGNSPIVTYDWRPYIPAEVKVTP